MDRSPRTATDDARQKFNLAYAKWKDAQAAVATAEASYNQSDTPMSKASDRLHETICTLLTTQAAAPYQLLHKLELVDDLVTREKTMGESAANYPARAMASLKIDLMNLTEIMEAVEIPA